MGRARCLKSGMLSQPAFCLKQVGIFSLAPRIFGAVENCCCQDAALLLAVLYRTRSFIYPSLSSEENVVARSNWRCNIASYDHLRAFVPKNSRTLKVTFGCVCSTITGIWERVQVVDHYENPRNVGSLDKKDANVGTGLVGAPACGDVMKLQVSWSTVHTVNQRTELD
jgi:hypothetical protein